MRTPIAWAILATCLASAACTAKDDKLAGPRNELRQVLDAAYENYGGGALAAKAKAEAGEHSGAAAQHAALLVAEADRAVFEKYCIAAGKGEHLFNASVKLDEWLKNERNKETCRMAAKASAKLAEAEALSK
ncbi:MAG: hypothetical protein WCK73_05945 [Deltaproteobacteria bacterium]